MIHIVEGSIFDLPRYSVLIHQVNCIGSANGGLALQMRERFPRWFDSYKDHCDKYSSNRKELLGTVRRFDASDDLIICDAFGQLYISKARQTTDFAAWEKIMKKIESSTAMENRNGRIEWSVHMPYMIGCGLGGGDWDEMAGLIDFIFSDSPVHLWIHMVV